MIEIDYEKVKELLRKGGCHCVYIQIPEGLKPRANELYEKLVSEGYRVIIDLDPTYGFCDLRDDYAKLFNCDCLLHIGHNSFGYERLVRQARVKVIVYELRYRPSRDKLEKIIRANLDILERNSPLGLVSSLQFLDFLSIIKKILESYGIVAILPKNPQILGCNVANAKAIEDKVKAFLLPTEGSFYPLGLALETNKKVLALDLERESITDYEKMKRKYLLVKHLFIEKFKEAKKVALLVSTKKGQVFFDPLDVKEIIEKLGKKVYIFSMNEFDESKLLGIDVDIYVNLSCPRIFDNYERFEKPIINWQDIMRFLNLS